MLSPGVLLAVVPLAAREQAPLRRDRRTDPTQSVTTLTHPIAPVVAIRTDGNHVNQVTVQCPFCRGQHTYEWFDEPDGLRQPTCGACTSYLIRIGARARMDRMRADFPAPDGVVGLVPLHIGYCFEVDGPDEDVVGIVLETTLGKFAVWLPMASAVGLAGQLVDIAGNADHLRLAYLERTKTATQIERRAANAAGVV
jgi:hypothetical protein